MHQETEQQSPVEENYTQQLLRERAQLMNNYRNATQHAIRALDYYQRFKRVEDWDEPNTQDDIKVFQQDSRRFLREVAIDVRRMRNRLDVINNELMDIVKKEKENERKRKRKEESGGSDG